MTWKRPEHIPYPSVWHTFQAKDTESDQVVTYRVQDLPEERFEEAIAHMMEYFVYDEPTCRAKGKVRIAATFAPGFALTMEVLFLLSHRNRQ